MKKLITIMASAAVALFAFGAFAETLNAPTGTSFEDYTGELKTDYTDDGASTSGDLYWYIDGKTENDEFTITNHLNGSGDFPTRPEMFSGANNNYLSIEAATNLYRTILGNSAGSDIKQVDIGNGIYLDTMVKFTAAESAFGESDIAAGDKLAISYVEHGEDALDPNNPDDFTFTNIVVRAGYVDGSTITPKNYRLNLPEDFVSTNWHRLTVRAISDVGYANAPVAFAVYVDTNLLTYAISEQAGTSAYETALAGNATVATYLYNSEKHALLPSLVNSGAVKDTLSAVGFKGNGCIDDVSFTASKPSFIVENTMVTIAWETGVTNYTVIANGSTPITNENVSAAGEVLLTLDPSITTLTVEAQYDATHKPGKWIASNGAENLDGNVWTIEKDGKLTITSIVPKFQVGDKFFDSFDDALDEAAGSSAASRGTVVVLDDYTGNITVDGGFVMIDLAGKTINGEGNDAPIYIEGSADVIITNSTSEIGHVVPASADEAVYLAEGVLAIYGGWFEGEVFDDTGDADALAVYGGYYLDEYANEDPNAFYLYDEGNTKDTVTYAGNDYFLVGTAAPAPTTFALTTTGGENAEIVTDPADVSALTVATSVTITATATNGFTYATVDLSGTDWSYNSNDDAISMATNISENTTVVVPDAVSEQSSDDWPTGQDLDDVAGKAAGDQFPGITNALATADAKAVATWAEANNVEYAAKGSILPEAFLLNCANTQEAIDAAAANFKITTITVVGDTVTITPADGADYCNGKVVIEGTATLSPISWHEKTDGDHFFRATLVVKPVAVP